MCDMPDIPEFLRREPRPPGLVENRVRSNDGRPKLKNPTGKKVGRWLPQSMDATARAILRQEERAAAQARAERFAKLKELRK